LNILHISNDFAGSRVHGNLVKELDAKGLRQIVYCPVRKPELIGKNSFQGDQTTLVYSYVLRPWHRVLFHLKIRTVFHDMLQRVNFSNIDLIHAATVFSDGALALQAYRRWGLPYVVAVRSTDVDDFGRLAPHLWSMGRQVLKNSSRIYFISEALRQRFWQMPWTKGLREKIEERCVLRPNGIDDYWLSHINRDTKRGRDILYVGDFLKRKNVPRLINAVNMMRQREELADIKLTLVGGVRNEDPRVARMIKRNGVFVKYLGPITDRLQLSMIMRQHGAFCMPSQSETFGLVYVEALSQGLPIVYSRGTGIDGIFQDEKSPVGLAVRPDKVEDICEALCQIVTHPEHYGNLAVDFSRFDWEKIADKYMNDYKAILSENKG